jgi:hypothetical protein
MDQVAVRSGYRPMTDAEAAQAGIEIVRDPSGLVVKLNLIREGRMAKKKGGGRKC